MGQDRHPIMCIYRQPAAVKCAVAYPKAAAQPGPPHLPHVCICWDGMQWDGMGWETERQSCGGRPGEMRAFQCVF